MSEFFVWRSTSVPRAAVFTDLRGFEELNLFDSGQPLRATFPPEAALHLDPAFTGAIELTDSPVNSLQLIDVIVHPLGLVDCIDLANTLSTSPTGSWESSSCPSSDIRASRLRTH